MDRHADDVCCDWALTKLRSPVWGVEIGDRGKGIKVAGRCSVVPQCRYVAENLCHGGQDKGPPSMRQRILPNGRHSQINGIYLRVCCRLWSEMRQVRIGWRRLAFQIEGRCAASDRVVVRWPTSHDWRAGAIWAQDETAKGVVDGLVELFRANLTIVRVQVDFGVCIRRKRLNKSGLYGAICQINTKKLNKEPRS